MTNCGNLYAGDGKVSYELINLCLGQSWTEDVVTGQNIFCLKHGAGCQKTKALFLVCFLLPASVSAKPLGLSVLKFHHL